MNLRLGIIAFVMSAAASGAISTWRSLTDLETSADYGEHQFIVSPTL